MKYKAVIFDLFGTLVDSFPQHDYDNFMADIAVIVGVNVGDFQKQWISAYKLRATGQQTTRESVVFCANEIGVNPNSEQIDAADGKIMAFTKNHLEPRTDVIPTLQNLRKLGLKIGLISDCSSVLEDLWEGLHIADFVDVPVFSSRVGVKKPSPVIYEFALDALDVNAEDCLYIGDGGSFELTGAEKMGMTAIMIDANTSQDVVQYEVQEWHGTTITSISQVLNHLN
ncbi:MAG: HAD-IA family hydrolase [Planctomycetes bacterium]|nr:HAD-IA family hydrolase [Planctomycetota bacterium]